MKHSKISFLIISSQLIFALQPTAYARPSYTPTSSSRSVYRSVPSVAPKSVTTTIKAAPAPAPTPAQKPIDYRQAGSVKPNMPSQISTAKKVQTQIPAQNASPVTKEKERPFKSISDMKPGEFRTRTDPSGRQFTEQKTKNGHISESTAPNGDKMRQKFVNGKLASSTITDAQGNKKVLDGKNREIYRETKSKNFFGRETTERTFSRKQSVGGKTSVVNNHYYVDNRSYGGRNYGYYSPGASLGSILAVTAGVALTTAAVVAIYHAATVPYYSPYYYPPTYWASTYECSIFWGCAWRPRPVYVAPYQAVSDHVVGSYYQDQHDRMVADQAVSNYKRGVEDGKLSAEQAQQMAAVEERLRSEIDEKVKNALANQARQLKNQELNAQGSPAAKISAGIPKFAEINQLILAHDHLMLTTPGTDAQCNIFEGDALRVVRQDEKLDEEGKTQLTLIMKVEKANPNKKFGCTIGDEVSADLAQVVEMENAFQLKVEQSLAKMEKEKQGK